MLAITASIFCTELCVAPSGFVATHSLAKPFGLCQIRGPLPAPGNAPSILSDPDSLAGECPSCEGR